MEDEVLNKYKVEESNKEAFKGRSAPLERRRVPKNKKLQNQKVEKKIAGQEFSPCLENTTCSVCKASRRSRRKKRR